MNIWPSWCVWIPKWNFLHDFVMWLRCRNMCTQTPCRLWQVEHCLHSRLFPILRFSWPNPILILIPDYSQTTPILRFFPDYSQSQMTPNLTSLPAYSLLSDYSDYPAQISWNIISRLLFQSFSPISADSLTNGVCCWYQSPDQTTNQVYWVPNLDRMQSLIRAVAVAVRS